MEKSTPEPKLLRLVPWFVIQKEKATVSFHYLLCLVASSPIRLPRATISASHQGPARDPVVGILRRAGLCHFLYFPLITLNPIFPHIPQNQRNAMKADDAQGGCVTNSGYGVIQSWISVPTGRLPLHDLEQFISTPWALFSLSTLRFKQGNTFKAFSALLASAQ